MKRGPPRSTLFPSPPLFRSVEIGGGFVGDNQIGPAYERACDRHALPLDRKSTRLHSSHTDISRMPSFSFNEARTTEIYPLPLPAALPICRDWRWVRRR